MNSLAPDYFPSSELSDRLKKLNSKESTVSCLSRRKNSELLPEVSKSCDSTRKEQDKVFITLFRYVL